MVTESRDIAFIVPHRGRDELLRQTIESICKQDYDLSHVEVIVVTQSGAFADGIPSVFGAVSIRTIERPESDSISRLRNIGVEKSTGEYLAFLDADVSLAPNWIDAMLFELQADPARQLVSAVQRNSVTAPALERIRTVLSNAVTDCCVEFLPGRNLFLRRDTFITVGGFPEHLMTCEDYFFTQRVHDLGQLYYSSRSHYVHLGEDKRYDEMFRKEIWRGQSNLKSIRGRRIPLREWPSVLVPFWMLLFVLGGLTCFLARHWGLALTAWAVAAAPIVAYSFRLHRIARGSVQFRDTVRFYALYFPARIVGSLVGLFRSFKP